MPYPRSPRRVAKFLAAVCTPVLGVLTGCTEPVTFAPVTIADATVPWDEHATPRVLEARVEAPEDDWTVEDVYVRHTRHWWPGPAAAHEAVAEAVDAAAGLWRAVPTQATGAADADVLLWQWFVDYRLEGGEEILTTSSAPAGAAPHRMVIGCTRDDIDATFEQVRRAMNRFRPANGQIGDNPGYAVPAHFSPVSLAGQGVPYAEQLAVFALGEVSAGSPELLLYAPRPRSEEESESEYLEIVTDDVPDPPYRLLGVAYGLLHSDAANRPRLGCIPSDEWFVHEAGFHTPDGGFMPADVDEAVPGATAIDTLLPPPDATATPPPVNSAWHPRIWDLHFWLSNAGATRPILSIDAPDGQVGLAVPPGTFFRPQTFQ